MKTSFFNPLPSVLLFTMLLLSSYGCGQTEQSATMTTPTPTTTETEPAKTIADIQHEDLPAEEAVAAPPDESQAPPTTNPIGEEPLTTEETAAENAVSSRLRMANINEPQAAKDFLAQMRGYAIANDQRAIASLINYPFTTYDGGSPVKTYNTPDELLSDFDQVVTPTVLSAMTEAQYKDIFVNYQGAMIGHGAVWFVDYGEGIRIKAINGQ